MKIAGLIFGNSGTLTKDMLKKDHLEQRETLFEKVSPLSSSMREEIEKTFLRSLPIGAEHTFTQIEKEYQILDLPPADIYVVFPFQSFHDRWLHALYSHNKPIIISPLPFSKMFSYGNVFYPYFIRDSREIDSMLNLPHNVFLSKDEKDLSLILRSLYIKHRVNHTRVLCIGEPMYEPFHSWDWGYSMVRVVQEKFGLKWKYMSSEKFLKYWRKWEERKDIDINDMKKSAHRIYISEEKRLLEAKKMYLALKSIIRENKADAFTINCLASIILPKLERTPCYALSKLNDEGIPSACEADTTTLLDMLITVYTSESPGFMANPYLFPSDNRILLSHCTSPTLHSYKEKKRDEFDLYTYFDHPTNLALAPQVLKNPETVTITGISHNFLNKMLIIKGEIQRNTYFSTCRTQVEIKIDNEVKEIAKNYQGRHWIMVYGDHRESLKRANNVLGVESIIY